MTFNQVWDKLLQGKKIKLPTWKGYWVWENDTIMMHCRDGQVIDIRDTENVAYTFNHVASKDWEVLP